MKEIFNGVFEENMGKRKLLFTENLAEGAHFSESIIKQDGREYRQWDARRSKLAAAILKGLKELPIKKGSIVLYLGASHGVTASYISDIIGKEGFIFAVDFSPRVVRELVYVAEKRSNIAPILADASHPEEYKDEITQCDILYQDIAQKNQVQIFEKNADLFLKKNGWCMLALKARSIDVTKNPKLIFEEAKKQLMKNFEIVQYLNLEPFEKDHAFFLCKKKD